MSGGYGPERVSWQVPAARRRDPIDNIEELQALAARLRAQRERPTRRALTLRAYRVAQLIAAARAMADRYAKSAATLGADAAAKRQRAALWRLLDELAVETIDQP